MLDTDREEPDTSASGECYWLVGLDGAARHVRLAITAPVLVGRATYNHVVLEDSRLSRQHSRFAAEREGCVVYDLNSANGTYVNNVRITRHVLKPDDIVRVGPFSFRIEHGELPSERLTPVLETQTLSGLEAARPPESVARMLSAAPGIDSAARLPALDLNELEDAYEKLGTLYAFMQAISKTLDRRELLRVMTSKIREVYGGASVRILLRPEGGGELLLAHEASDRPSKHGVGLPDDVRGEVLGGGMAVLWRSPDGLGTDMYVPIIDRGQVLGVIHVSGESRAFSRADLDLLNGMASPAAIMLQNTRMHQESLARHRLDHDLTLAAQIQKSFLPREVISVEGVELFAEYRAAYTVGGDFYDVFWVAPDRLGVFIGDISGKGVSAALLMARISSELRVAALAHIDPVKVLSTMNKATLVRGQPEIFFTAVYFTVDVKSGEILLANAGHCLPYLVKSTGGIEPVTDGAGGPVGILDDTSFEATTFRLFPGDSLVLYTDGVIEAANAHGVLYGQNRLESTLSFAGSRPNILAEHIVKSVEEHSSNGPPNDDLTLLICHRSIGKGATLQPRRRSSRFPQPMTPTDPIFPRKPGSSRPPGSS